MHTHPDILDVKRIPFTRRFFVLFSSQLFSFLDLMKSAIYICLSQTAIRGLLKMILPLKISGRLALVFAFLSALSLCGQNLISNYSFEDTISCPDGLGQISKAKGWFNYNGTADYYNKCSNSKIFGVPDNALGSQMPATGNAYSGVNISLYSDYRELLGIKLLMPLKEGQRYFFNCQLSLADKSINACSGFGIAFSNDSAKPITLWANNKGVISTLNVINDYNNWITIAGSFIADSNYKYMMLGNFNTVEKTTIEESKSPSGQLNDIYYFLDDICLSKDSTCFKANNMYNLSFDVFNIPKYIIYPNPANNLLWIANPFQSEIKIIIRNCTTKVVLKKQMKNFEPIDMSELPSGLYLIEIIDETNYSSTIKFIKM